MLDIVRIPVAATGCFYSGESKILPTTGALLMLGRRS